MRRCLRIAAAAGFLFSFSTGVLADVPPAMDRIPPDVYVVTTIRNLEQFQSNIEGLARQMGLPPDAFNQLGAARQILQTPGLNAQGSASIALLNIENSDQNFIAVIPVQDYRAFITGIGGQGEGIDEVEIEGETMFMKSLGDGFAAAGPTREIVEKFEGRAGHSAAHEAFLGATGRAIADDSGFFIVANMPLLAPRIREGIEAAMGQAQMMGAMMGGGMPDLGRAQEISEAFLRDATAGVMGLRTSERGARLDVGAQFREGSELAGFFDARGQASTLINSLPNQPFLFAMAMDASAPGLRRALQQLMPAAPAGEAQAGALNPLRAFEHADGVAVLWGTTPALMGGLFLNTVMYARTADPNAYIGWMRDSMRTLNSQKIEGMTYQTTMQDQQAAGRQVQSWSVRMQPERGNPTAQQAAQVQMMMFGPTGMGGFVARGERGVITTFSRNSDLLEQALNAANTDAGLSQEEGIRAISQNLPQGRTFEAYIGVRHILETALGFMGMMGGGPVDFEVPETMPPVAMGGTTSEGGVRMTMFVPTEVMSALRELQESMGGDDDWEEDDNGAGLPRF
jgi:hypothetical protein